MKRRNQILGIVISVIMILTMIPAISFGAGIPFTDVPADAWYYSDVQSAYDTGLVNGKTSTTFEPDSNMTYAEAVKLAACMHQKYTAGSVTLANGSPNWWDSYVEYAYTNGIIGKNYSWDSPATRAGYVEIFAYALPDEALKEINSIADGYIPDVGSTHPQGPEIYRLYRAGILTGMDDIGTFMPDSNIKRSEVSAILTRMMNESARKKQTTGISYTITFQSNGGSAVESQTVAQNGKAIRPADPVKEGCGFLGWCTDETLTKAYDFDRAVTGDLTLYAKWSDLSTETFTVAFNSNSGSMVMPQQVKGYGKATKPEDPVRERMEYPMGSGHYIVYTFAGWFTDKELTKAYDFDSLVTEDVILYAKWEEISDIEVHFRPRGGEMKNTQLVQQVPKNGKAVRPDDPIREYGTFLGWYTDTTFTQEYDFDTPVTEEIWLEAKWEIHYDEETITDSWEEIIASVNDGTYLSKYKIGDTKAVDFARYDFGMKGGIVVMQIVGFNVDEKADHSGTAAITWVSKNLVEPWCRMYEPSGHGLEATGGWKNCIVRTDEMPFFCERITPEVLQDAIVPVVKSGQSTEDKIWIPSAREIFGGTSYETTGPDYSACFQTAADRIMEHEWWLRTVADSDNFYIVDSSGAISQTPATKLCGVLLGFCI